VKEFQARGGIVVGDERLAPAITPDITLAAYQRVGRADQDQAALVALADELRAKLSGRYAWQVDSSSAEIIPYRRRAGSSDYVFVVNDRRQYGEYVGQHGIVMENGLPATATLWLARPAGCVYDLVAGCAVPSRQEQGRLAIEVAMGPCDGRVFLVCDRPIGAVRVHGLEAVDRGGAVPLNIEVLGDDDRPLDAVVPLEVLIRDAEGRSAEHSGFYAARGGKLEVALEIAVNDRFGLWQVEVRELASGRTATHYFRVNGPADWPPGRKPVDRDLANPVQPKG
jgi:hypothetical protein